MSLSKFLLGDSSSIDKNAYIYNSIYGLFNAIQAVVILAVLTRISGLAVAGVFTIAWTIANMMLNIGKFGMRSYQATDIKKEYSFNHYYVSRVISVLIMLISSVAYVVLMKFVNNYNFEKILMVILLTLIKAIDAVEDVFYGEYQRVGRMDVASKCSAIRLALTVITYSVLIILTKNLIASTVATLIISVILAIVLINSTFSSITGNPIKQEIMLGRNQATSKLLKSCLIIFISLFLYYLIVNYPKIAMDLYMTSEDQSIFGFICMPVFVVDLLSQFLYMPKLKNITDMIVGKEFGGVKKFIKMQLLVTSILTVLAVVVALTFGTPVLSLIYGADLLPFVNELTILMVGSGFMAYSYFAMNVLIVLRKQNYVIYSFELTTVVMFVICLCLIKSFGILGACISYSCGMGVLALSMSLLLYKYGKGICF